MNNPDSTAFSNVDTVLFDLDGTLSHSESGILGSLRHALTTEGIDVPTYEILRTAIGPPFRTGLPDIGVPLDRVEDVIVRADGVPVFSREIEDRVLAQSCVEKACLVRDPEDPHAFGMAVVPAGHFRPEDVAEALSRDLPDFARPTFLRVTADLPFTAGFRPAREKIASWGREPRPGDVIFDFTGGGAVPLAAEAR